jgi:hypothetical protein
MGSPSIWSKTVSWPRSLGPHGRGRERPDGPVRARAESCTGGRAGPRAPELKRHILLLYLFYVWVFIIGQARGFRGLYSFVSMVCSSSAHKLRNGQHDKSLLLEIENT